MTWFNMNNWLFVSKERRLIWIYINNFVLYIMLVCCCIGSASLFVDWHIPRSIYGHFTICFSLQCRECVIRNMLIFIFVGICNVVICQCFLCPFFFSPMCLSVYYGSPRLNCLKLLNDISVLLMIIDIEKLSTDFLWNCSYFYVFQFRQKHRTYGSKQASSASGWCEY